MKKKILLALSLVAVVALSIGGTVAFLTDKAEDKNTFTIGNVDIQLTSKLKTDGAIQLMPNNTDKLTADYKITNVGDSDAYVWLRVYIPKAVEDAPGLATDNIIHWNVPGAFWYGYHNNKTYVDKAIAAGYLPAGSTGVEGADTWLVSTAVEFTEVVDGVEYNVYDVLYNSALEKNETTNVGISTIYMDERLDYVDTNNDVIKDTYGLVKNGVVYPINYDFKNGASIKVEAHAIQANGFKNVEEAHAAYVKQWTK